MQFLVCIHKSVTVAVSEPPENAVPYRRRGDPRAFAARIPAQASIDPTVPLSHDALAVVVTREAQIGPRCIIGMQVLLGSRGRRRWPILEKDVATPGRRSSARCGSGGVVGVTQGGSGGTNVSEVHSDIAPNLAVSSSVSVIQN